MSAWTDLVSVALLGTERREPPALFEPALSGLEDGSAEERLLIAAGAVALQRRAGRRALRAPAMPAPAAAETVRPCPAAAASRLVLLLDERRWLLSEWLRALAARGLGAPAERLPDLLDAATTTHALRREVEAVLGERGRWLAQLEPRWGWAAPLPAGDQERESLWTTGERWQRRRIFTLLRREDPERARGLLDGGWRDEPPEERAWFVGALGEGLSAADEPLLERALDDRRQEVRAAAARLLARLGDSAFAHRMRERTLRLVRLEDGRRARVHVTLPDALDQAAVRDGIARRPPQGIGERAWWLSQLVAFTPLAAWEEAGLTPALAARLPASDDLEGPLRTGFARAAEAQRDARWAVAFADLEPRLAELLEGEDAASFALERLRAGELDIARLVPAPWPGAASTDALELLVEVVLRGGDWRRPRLIAERLDPMLADEAARRLDGLDPTSAQARQAEESLSLLAFRRDMYQELE